MNRLIYVLAFMAVLNVATAQISTHTQNVVNPIVEDGSKNNLDTTLRSVTFQCPECTENNKFKIIGASTKEFKDTKFPLQVDLQTGDYRMVYFQNKIQQINLPFKVTADKNNVIRVK